MVVVVVVVEERWVVLAPVFELALENALAVIEVGFVVVAWVGVGFGRGLVVVLGEVAVAAV